MLTARDIMTTDIVSVKNDLSVTELAGILTENKISGVPVLDAGGNLVGVVTENDLIDRTKKIHIPTAVALLDAFLFLENPEKLEKDLSRIQGKLNNASFVDKAPAEVVAKEREKMQGQQQALEQLREQELYIRRM